MKKQEKNVACVMYEKLIVFELSDFENFKIAILGHVCGHITFANIVIYHSSGVRCVLWTLNYQLVMKNYEKLALQ